MPKAWKLLDRVDTPEGPLELRQGGPGAFLISIAGRVLMTSRLQRSEIFVAQAGCAPIAHRPTARVLVGGLGLGFTLRAALDALGPDATVQVAELNPVVVDWCRGPCAGLTQDALADPRVEVHLGDFTDAVRAVSRDPSAPRYDAIVLDLYLGPSRNLRGGDDPLYGRRILADCHAALAPGGVYAVWGEDRDPAFERRVEQTGFTVRYVEADGGGPRHAVVIGRRRAQVNTNG